MELVVAGIDLGGKTTARTSIAVLRGERGGRPAAQLLVTDADGRALPKRAGTRQLAEAVVATGAEVVGIDAPLSLPHPLTCTDPDCRRCFPEDGAEADYSSRHADRAPPWRAAGHTASPMSTAMLGAITFRGIYLRRALERTGTSVVETWPRGIYESLSPGAEPLPRVTDDEVAYVAGAALRLRPHVDLPDDLATPHDVDALACGLAMWHHVLADEPVHVGDDEASICVCTTRAR